MLSELANIIPGTDVVEHYEEYVDEHVKTLKDAEVDHFIVEHYKALCDAWLPVVRDSVAQSTRWD